MGALRKRFLAVFLENSNVIGLARAEISASGPDSTRKCARESEVECGPLGLDRMDLVGTGGVLLSYSIAALLKYLSSCIGLELVFGVIRC